MGVGVVGDVHGARAGRERADRRPRRIAALLTPQGLFDAMIGPFVVFFREHGSWALLMLLAISLYRLPDFVLGPMANPFYADLGIDKETVGAVRGSFGLVATIAGHRRRRPVRGAFRLRPDPAGRRGAGPGRRTWRSPTSRCTAPTPACSPRRW